MPDEINTPDDFESLYDRIDREMRAYVTAVILQEEPEKERIHRLLVDLEPRPEVMAMILGTWFNMTRYLLMEYSGASTPVELLDVWINTSRDIELDILTNGKKDGTE